MHIIYLIEKRIRKTYIFHASTQIFHMTQKQLSKISAASQKYSMMDIQLEILAVYALLHYGIIDLKHYNKTIKTRTQIEK